MKAAELTVGLEIAVTDGTSPYDQKTTKATRCKVLGPPQGGYVSVELLEDAKSRLGNRALWNQEGWKKKGDRHRAETRNCWMPWASLETRADNERRIEKEREESEAESEERLAELQRRVDQFAGEVDGAMAWGRSRSVHRSVGIGAIPRDHEDTVRMPTEALEALLKAAER